MNMDDQDVSEIMGPMFESLAKDGAAALKALDLPADAKVLDVGTGEGKFAIFLALQGFDVLTGEPATDETRYAGKDWASAAGAMGVRDKIRFEPFDAGAMPFEADSFGAVFFFGVLHHIDEQNRADALREALRVVKPDGAVVFFEPKEATLEKLWVKDPGHPPAADPSAYLAGQAVTEERRIGAMMDIFIYRHAS